MKVGLAAIASLMAIACGDDPVRILDGACAFGEEHALAPIHAASGVDDVAIVRDGEGAWAVWSEPGGTYLRGLAGPGAPNGELLRVGGHCDGGLAAQLDGDRLVIACGRRGDDAKDDPGGVRVIAVRG